MPPVPTSTVPLLAAVMALLTAHPAAGADPAVPEDPRLPASRQAVNALAGDLKAALTEGLAAGGPPAAIGVCRDQAQAIADARSRDLGARVGRTSERLRNPANAPTPEQRRVLKSFAERMAAGEAPGTVEHWERHGDGSALYMKPIIVGGPCLACHGREPAPGVAGVLKSAYPDDRATGYEIGDLRGAFLVAWPPE